MSKLAVEVAPLRTLQDFITDAQFTAPTLHDRDRMDNRMINNLIYYQTNYFLSAIIIFILVGTLYPKDLIICAVTLVCTVVLFGIAQRREQKIAKLKSHYLSLVPVIGIAVAMLIIYALGSILAFLWGVTVPLAVILLHAATRKRNIKNKFANMVKVFKEDVTPMTIILSKICTFEREQQETGIHLN